MTLRIGRRGVRGQSLVETAIILPLIILIFMGVFDFGRAIFYYNSVAEAARNGARVAIVNQTTADICRVAAERATGLGLLTACATLPTPVGVYVSGCTSFNCQITVRVNYRFTAITPIISNIVGPINLTSTSRGIVERECPPTFPGETACPVT